MCATNQDLQTYIDSCHKESEIRAAYPEQSNAHLNNIVNITVNSDSITPHKKKNGREEDRQDDFHITFDKNEENKSIFASETIEPNASETIELSTSNKIEQIARKRKEIERYKNEFNPHFKAYLNNLPIP